MNVHINIHKKYGFRKYAIHKGKCEESTKSRPLH